MIKRKKLTLLLTLMAVLWLGAQPGLAQATTPPDTYCRFGIGLAKGASGYDLTQLGVGSFLDWKSNRDSTVPASIRYFHVLRVSDAEYAQTFATLPQRLSDHPGAVWIVGNEPDAEVTYQDHVRAEIYAQRYFELASRIRTLDPSAIIGFGTVIQPTPIRLFYLNLALAELDKKTGSRSATAKLIDVFSIHNFILNEQPIYNENGVAVSWGAGVPPGYQAGVWPDPHVITIGGESDQTDQTHSIEIFKERVIKFREWMNQQSLRTKPLWITEYGSLFPSVGNLYLTVSETDTINFLQQTMDFMLTATNSTTGYAHDSNRLVQHFVWYSLNEDRWRFGGSLYNPDNNQLTLVGERYINYDPPASANLPRKPADLYVLPGSLTIVPIGKTSPDLVNYRVTFRTSNAIASEYRTQVMVKLYDNGILVGQEALTLPRCGGQSVVRFTLNAQQPGTQHQFRAEISLLGGNGPETNPGNDSLTFPNLTLPPIYQIILTSIYRN